MRKAKELPTQDYLKSRFNYDPISGSLTWKPLDEYTHQDRAWNGRYANREVGDLLRNGYRKTSLNSKQYLVHRLVFKIVNGFDPPGHIDHIDKMKDNNSISNLRVASNSENLHNVGKPRTNTTGHKNISIYSGAYYVGVETDGVKTRARFKNLDDAIQAAEALRKELHGEFASA